MSIDKLDEFTRAYIECALWLTRDDRDNTPIDSNHDITDIAPETMGKIIADCAKFQLEYSAALKNAYNHDDCQHCPTYTPSQAGHDFWLTRNGHGAGFWDRGLGKHGDVLTEACKSYPMTDLYIGDDGKIYQS